jgi:hypothetical protein
MNKAMTKTHWLIGFLFFLFVMLASGCKSMEFEWVDQSDLVDDFRYLPRMFSGGDPRIKTAEETKFLADRQAAETGLMSMSEYNQRMRRAWWTEEGGLASVPNGVSNGIENRIQPPGYYRWHGKILPIPRDQFSPDYKQYLRRKSYGKK